MRAMLLCAGLGTRLGEIGLVRPKPMLKIGQHSILEFGIANLVGHGIRDLVINTHHLGDVIRNEIGDGRQLGARITYIHEDALLGTGGGLKNALGLLDPDRSDEPFISLNGKLIFDVDLSALVASFRAAEVAAKQPVVDNGPVGPVLGMMVVTSVPDAVAWGAVDVRFPDDKSTSAGPWVSNVLGEGAHMFCGVHITRPSVVARLPDGEACMIRQGYLPWLKAGARVGAWLHKPTATTGYFAEHSTPERYRESEQFLLSAADTHHRSKFGTSSAPGSPIIAMPLRFPPGRLLPE
jgi:mannose-1-phosphate guanylyltransferase